MRVLFLLCSLILGEYSFGKTVIFFRHGEALHNELGVLNSNPLHPKYFVANLTKGGEDRVESSAKEALAQVGNKKFALYFSPLPRTCETAEIIARVFDKNIVEKRIEERLLELQAGPFESVSLKELTWSPWYKYAQQVGGETEWMLKKRLILLVQDLAKDPNENFVLVSHASTHDYLHEMLVGTNTHPDDGRYFLEEVDFPQAVKKVEQLRAPLQKDASVPPEVSKLVQHLKEEEDGMLSFGVMTDSHLETPKNPEREKRLEQAIEALNSKTLAFSIILGDVIDKDFATIEKFHKIWDGLKTPKYQVLGNHDFEVAENKKDQVLKAFGLQKTYMSFVVKSLRFVMLNGNEINPEVYPQNSPMGLLSSKEKARYESQGRPVRKYEGALGNTQLSWVQKELEEAKAKNQQVVFFCHQQLLPMDSEEPHHVWDSEELIAIMDQFSNIRAVITGHRHRGAFAQRNGVHFIGLTAMREGEGNAFATIDLYEDGRLKVNGSGRQPDIFLYPILANPSRF